jgi:undecaprenyl-diphosphatase
VLFLKICFDESQIQIESVNKMRKQKDFRLSVWLLAAFVLWTVAVRFVDVQPIGPDASSVGFAALNRFVRDLTGVHMDLYTVTDWLSIVPLVVAAVFAALGLSQWLQRKHILKVDFSILILGIFYLVVFALYILFDMIAVNYRPVLIDGLLEPSYPSSTTMLVMCVMPTAAMQCNGRIGNKLLKRLICAVILFFVVFMVVGRLISGVHWFTDIIGGALLSGGLVLMYRAIVS